VIVLVLVMAYIVQQIMHTFQEIVLLLQLSVQNRLLLPVIV